MARKEAAVAHMPYLVGTACTPHGFRDLNQIKGILPEEHFGTLTCMQTGVKKDQKDV